MEDFTLPQSEKETRIYKIYLKMRDLIWNEKKIQSELHMDRGKLSTLNPGEYAMNKKVSSIFGGIDYFINEYNSRIYLTYFTAPRYQLAFAYQNYIEGIHQITYNEFINIYYGDTFDVAKEIREDPATQEFIDWLKAFMPNNPYIDLPLNAKRALESIIPHDILYENKKLMVAKALIASCLIEGAFIPTFFAKVFWFKHRGLLGGFTKANEYIEADEFWHLILGGECFKDLELDEQSLKNLYLYFKVAASALLKVIESYCSYMTQYVYPGLTLSQLMTYVKSRVDITAEEMGFSKVYNQKNEIGYMESRMISSRSTSHFTSSNFEYDEGVEDTEPFEF
jgi:ribonucleoside-diphosphate reductase beta chain